MNKAKLYDPWYLTAIKLGLVQDCPFNSDVFYRYLGFLNLNKALPPLFTKRPVREIMLGFESSFLKEVQTTNITSGGNPTIQTYFSVLPEDNSLFNVNNWTLLTGENDAEETRRVNSYNSDLTYITDIQKTFVGLDSNNTPIYTEEIVSPWDGELYYAEATDGIQFAPN